MSFFSKRLHNRLFKSSYFSSFQAFVLHKMIVPIVSDVSHFLNKLLLKIICLEIKLCFSVNSIFYLHCCSILNRPVT